VFDGEAVKQVTMSNKDKIEALKNDVKGLKDKIKTLRDQTNDNSLTKISADAVTNLPNGTKHKMKRTLKGHLAKIYATSWAHQDNVHLGMHINIVNLDFFLASSP
jgi:guanine nucleotide-binding protein G(I)/G(S)/G(T) subunit beta-1